MIRYKILSLIILLILCAKATQSFCQEIDRTHDSVTYNMQREKVNALLDARKEKFGQYDESLVQKTGIFGIFKTKKDMQKSIDILKEIAITDNNIFLETKKLLDIKDYESEKYERLAVRYDQQSSAYMKTITKLQIENDELHKKIAELQTDDQGNNVALYFAVLIILGLLLTCLFLLKKCRSVKKLTKL